MSACAHVLVLTEALLLLSTSLTAIIVSTVHVVTLCLGRLDRVILSLLISHIAALNHWKLLLEIVLLRV